VIVRDSYAHGSSEQELLGETIGTNLAATVALFGDQEALVDVPSGRRWTYSELQSWAEGIARGLLAKGIAKGDRVGIWSPNCPEWVALQYGTALVGAILVNINPAYRVSELDYVLRQSGVRMLVSAAAYPTSDYPAMIEQVAPGVQSLTDIVYIGETSWSSLEGWKWDQRRRFEGNILKIIVRRSNQHPIYIGHDWLPQGCHLVPSQYCE
jgi:fatty-acyl-CoA synthase